MSQKANEKEVCRVQKNMKHEIMNMMVILDQLIFIFIFIFIVYFCDGIWFHMELD